MGTIKIGRMTIGVCATNTYFLYREQEKEAVVFDPADRGGDIFKALSEQGFRIAAICLTHGHFDHIWGAEELRTLSGAKIYALDAEKTVCQDAYVNISAQMKRKCTIEPD